MHEWDKVSGFCFKSQGMRIIGRCSFRLQPTSDTLHPTPGYYGCTIFRTEEGRLAWLHNPVNPGGGL
jgi:hypothetical protein